VFSDVLRSVARCAARGGVGGSSLSFVGSVGHNFTQTRSPEMKSLLTLVLIALAVVLCSQTFALADDVFVSVGYTNSIYKFTPDGTRTTFASGVDGPEGLAFNSSGDLFEAAASSDCIYRFAPDGTKSTFADGLYGPAGLTFDSSGNLFETDYYSGKIYKFSPSGGRTTFASGLL
jgi:hypothetical protein